MWFQTSVRVTYQDKTAHPAMGKYTVHQKSSWCGFALKMLSGHYHVYHERLHVLNYVHNFIIHVVLHYLLDNCLLAASSTPAAVKS